MGIKAKEAIGSQEKTVAVLDLSLPESLPESARSKIKQDVGDFLKEQVISSLRRAETPVLGEKWPGLSKEYANEKKRDGLPPEANMEFTGEMLDALDFDETDDGIELGFFGDQAWKADGHLKFSGEENNTPQRRFLPDKGQEFDSSIQDKAERIISDALADSIPLDKEAFDDISTKAELYDMLGEYFVDMSRAEIAAAVARTPELVDLLDELDLFDLL